jgi:hypothetical protein
MEPLGQTTLLEELLDGSDGKVLTGRFKDFAEQEKARGVVGDSQRKALPVIAELELALEIGAPEVVWPSQVVGGFEPFLEELKVW